MATGQESPAPANDYLAGHARLLADSFERLTGRRLGAENLDDGELARQLYHADFVLVSHGTEADPVFNYANLGAQHLFEMDWQTFVALPSRFSAEPVDRDERARLMARVSHHNYIDDYAGVRISSTHKRFRIEAATVWNVLDPDGQLHGQAACFDRWVFL